MGGELPASSDANNFFDSSGMRYSILHELPYFDPTRFVVVEPMHNLFLGLIKEHFQGILGTESLESAPRLQPTLHIDITPSSSNPLPETKPARAGIRSLVRILQSPLDFTSETESLKFQKLVGQLAGYQIHVASLVYVGHAVGCLPENANSDGTWFESVEGGTRRRKISEKCLATLLARWVGPLPSQLLQASDGFLQRLQQNSVSPRSEAEAAGHVSTKNEIEEIRADLERVVKPSWVTSIPTTLSSRGPRLNSDQWRYVGSLFLSFACGGGRTKDLPHSRVTIGMSF